MKRKERRKFHHHQRKKKKTEVWEDYLIEIFKLYISANAYRSKNSFLKFAILSAYKS